MSTTISILLLSATIVVLCVVVNSLEGRIATLERQMTELAPP